MSLFSNQMKKTVRVKVSDKKPAIASIDIKSISDNGGFVGFAKIGGNGYVGVNNIYVPFCTNRGQTKHHIHPEATHFYGHVDDLVKNYNLGSETERKIVALLLDERYQDKRLKSPHCNTSIGCLQHELGLSKVLALQHGNVFYCIPLEALQLVDRRKRFLEVLIDIVEKNLSQLTREWSYAELTSGRIPVLSQYPRSFEEEVRRQGGYYHCNHKLNEKARTPGEFGIGA